MTLETTPGGPIIAGTEAEVRAGMDDTDLQADAEVMADLRATIAEQAAFQEDRQVAEGPAEEPAELGA